MMVFTMRMWSHVEPPTNTQRLSKT